MYTPSIRFSIRLKETVKIFFYVSINEKSPFRGFFFSCSTASAVYICRYRVQTDSAIPHPNKPFTDFVTELIARLALVRSSPSTSLADVVCSFSRKSLSTRLRLIENSIFFGLP